MELTLDDLLQGRIRYRTAWAMREPLRKKVTQRAIDFELDYDERSNFARMGEEFVDDDWLVSAIARAKADERKAASKRKKMERWAA